MNRSILAGVIAVGLLATLPSTVSSAKVESETVDADWAGTYAIPEQVAELEALGELGQINHGCPSGLYFLVDGRVKLDATMTFTPSREAFENNDLGATMEARGSNKFEGLWATSENDQFPTGPSEYFTLRDNGIRFQFLLEVREFVNEEGEPGIGPVQVAQDFSWKGEFRTPDTDELVEDWRFRVSEVEGVLDDSSVVEGSCAG